MSLKQSPLADSVTTIVAFNVFVAVPTTTVASVATTCNTAAIVVSVNNLATSVAEFVVVPFFSNTTTATARIYLK